MHLRQADSSLPRWQLSCPSLTIRKSLSIDFGMAITAHCTSHWSHIFCSQEAGRQGVGTADSGGGCQVAGTADAC
jgi:hypothetical protein